jgi:hypothetical protein
MIWEYKTLALPSSTERQNMLSEMGLGGWELIGFEQGVAYFKRPKSIVINTDSAPRIVQASKKK